MLLCFMEVRVLIIEFYDCFDMILLRLILSIFWFGSFLMWLCWKFRFVTLDSSLEGFAVGYCFGSYYSMFYSAGIVFACQWLMDCSCEWKVTSSRCSMLEVRVACTLVYVSNSICYGNHSY